MLEFLPESRNAANSRSSGTGKANLLGTLGRHCLDLVPTCSAGCFFFEIDSSSLLEFFVVYAEHAIKKIRSSKRLELYFLRECQQSTKARNPIANRRDFLSQTLPSPAKPQWGGFLLGVFKSPKDSQSLAIFCRKETSLGFLVGEDTFGAEEVAAIFHVRQKPAIVITEK